MEQEGDKSQQHSAPESSYEIPLLTELSLWDPEMPLFSPLNSNIDSGYQQQSESSTYFDICNMFPNVEHLSSLSSPPPSPPPPSPPIMTFPKMSLGGLERGGTKRKSDVLQVPHTQSEEEVESVQKRKHDKEHPQQQQLPETIGKGKYAEAHNLCERKRRNRMSEKFESLKKLVPNCDKDTDQDSVLNENIKYVEFLQQPVDHLTTRLQSVQMPPHYSSFVPIMRPMMGMGMYNSAYAPGYPYPMDPFPLSGLNPLGGSRFLPSVPQLQYPFAHTTSQPPTYTVTTNIVTTSIDPNGAIPSTFVTNIPSTFSQGARSLPRTNVDIYQAPIIREGSRPQGLTTLAQATQIVRPPSLSRGLAGEINHVDLEAQNFPLDRGLAGEINYVDLEAQNFPLSKQGFSWRD